jgi:hypothetical protein
MKLCTTSAAARIHFPICSAVAAAFTRLCLTWSAAGLAVGAAPQELLLKHENSKQFL